MPFSPFSRAFASLPLAAGLLLAAAPSGLRAQASATLSPTDPVQRDAERLLGQGIADSVIVGQRPWSRTTVARLVRQAERAMPALMARDAARAAVVAETLARLRGEVGPELALLEGAAVTSLVTVRPSLDATSVGMPDRPIPLDNGLGGIDASTNPLADYREGRWLPSGTTSAAEVLLEGQAARWFVVLAQPRGAFAAVRAGDGAARADLVRGYARVVARNVVVELGRDFIEWGQGRDGGLLAATGAPALDLLLLANERPVVLPWIFRFAGPTRFSIFVSRLDGWQNFPHPYLVGYKASALPAPWLELGASIFTKGGGSGAPGASFIDRVSDALAFVDVVFRGDSDYQFSDKYAGGDMRLRIDALRGLEAYGEIQLNDLDFKRFASSIGEDAAHVAGLWLPRVDRIGRVDARVELHHTGIRQYRHHQFTSGQTLRGRLLGDPLGPDARGGYFALGWDASGRHRFAFDAALEERRADEYIDVTGGAATIDFERSVAHPRERRARALGGWEARMRNGTLRLFVQGGVERATNFDFIAGQSRTGGLARVSVSLGPAARPLPEPAAAGAPRGAP